MTKNVISYQIKNSKTKLAYNVIRFVVRSAREHRPLVPERPDQRRGVVRGQQAVGGVQEAAVRAVLLPRGDPGAAAVRPARLEHPLRVQRDRPQDQRHAALHVPQRV